MTNPPIDFYSSATSPNSNATTTLEDLIEAIRSDEFRPKIERLRACLAAGDDDAYSLAKKDLPAVSISGSCEGKRAQAIQEGRFRHSGFLQLDFDAVDNIGWEVDEIVEILRAEPRIVAAFVSPSGHGVKGIARIPKCKTREEHAAAFAAARNFFRGYNLVIDEACKDPVRLCFVSHDPDAWLDLARAAMFEPVAAEAPQQVTADEIDTQGTPSRGLILRLRSEAFPAPPVNGIHTWLMAAAWWCRIHDMTEPDAVAKLQAYDGSLRRRLQPTEVVDACRKVFAAERDSSWRVEADMAARLNPPSKSTPTAYAPDDIFYDQPGGRYYVRVGNTYHMHGKKSPIITGLARYLSNEIEDAKQLHAAVRATIADRELDGGVQWSGTIAGHRQGLAQDSDGRPILVLSEAIQPRPAAGNCDLVNEIISGAFKEPIAFEVFISWLAGRYRAVRDHTHIPSPMLVLAGEVNSGKSLLAWIASQCLGGRTANPYASWSGGMLWNDDLVGAELLLVDDCAGTTDIRARRAFGAAFKEAMYPHIVQLRKRHASSISVRPVWACVVCCNDTPEALQIIPPIDADMADKVALLHVTGVDLPVDTSTPAGKVALQQMIRAELPAFVAQLESWQTPEHLHDSRSGIMAWRDPDLLDAVDANSPARRIETLLRAAVEHRGIWHDLPRDLTAIEIETRLTDSQSPVRDQARLLFTWHGACGSALARLAKMDRGLVSFGEFDAHAKANRYRVES